MTIQNDRRHVLVVRPWLGTFSGGDAYAHFEALAMREAPGRWPERYGDYWVMGRGDDGRKTLRLDYFRFQCQIDACQEQSYAWRWGYQPPYGSVFGPDDLETYGPSIAAVKRALDRFDREDGPADSVGRFVIRLARALKLDGVAVLESSRTGSFRDEMEVRRRINSDEYGDAIRVINHLVLELHRSCQQRVGKLAG